METIRRLLETLEFQVDVFDGPDLDRPPLAEFQHRLLAADCVVLLLGPREPHPGQQDLEPAPWPAEEGIYAVAKEKPVALIVHPGTRIPESIRPLQTPARFDFWKPDDFVKKRAPYRKASARPETANRFAAGQSALPFHEASSAESHPARWRT